MNPSVVTNSDCSLFQRILSDQSKRSCIKLNLFLICPSNEYTAFLCGPLLLMGFKLMAGAVASCALIGVAVGLVCNPGLFEITIVVYSKVHLFDYSPIIILILPFDT